MPAIEFFHADLGEVSLHCAAAGPADAPLVLCLHGFPEYWAGWREVMMRLAGPYRVVAPDQRGFNLSSRPPGMEAYRARHLVDDVDRLAGRLSPGRPFVLAGHDWGASIAYAYAFRHPRRLTALVIANGVHPACFQRAIFEDAGQRAASQYINALRAGGMEDRLAEDGYRRMLRMISGFSRADWMSDDERAGYIAAWSRPGAMAAMLNWYRASPISVPAPDEPPGESPVLSLPDEVLTVTMPHLVLWGEADTALRPSCLVDLPRYAPDLTVRRVADAGHWILHEKPDRVAAGIRAFLER